METKWFEDIHHIQKISTFEAQTLTLMASDLITNLVGIFTKDRFEEIQDNQLHASDMQIEQLFNLLREAQATKWGKTYDFKSIGSYQDFRERIPVQSAETLEPHLKQIMDGTTNILWPGVPKRLLSSFNGSSVPITEQALAESFTQGAYDAMTIHMHYRQESRLFSGYFVHIGNETEPSMMDELDDFLKQNEPFILSLLNRPRFTGLIQLSDNHLRQLIKEMRTEKVSCFHGSIESLRRLLKMAIQEKGRLPAFITDAEVLFYRTVNTSETIKKSKEGLELPFRVQCAYCSPEGFIGIQDNPVDESFLLLLDVSQFYEFRPADKPNENPIPLEDVTINIDYQLILTTCSGLWRYLSEGPCLRFVSTKPYRFLLV